MKKIILVVGCLFILCLGCKKEEEKISTIPSLEFKSVLPSNPQQFTDSLLFTIRYKDGDGDLGENSPDVKNLFLIDNRIGITYEYRISELAPEGYPIPIEGDLNVVLRNISITDSSLTQNANFSIYVKDRAGNISNTITTSTIVIIR